MIKDTTTGDSKNVIIITYSSKFTGLGSQSNMTMSRDTWLEVKQEWLDRYTHHPDSVIVRDENDEDRAFWEESAKRREAERVRTNRLVVKNRSSRRKPAKYSPSWPSMHR